MIVSPNSGYALIGLENGTAEIISTTMPSHLTLKTLNFFPNFLDRGKRNYISMQLEDLKYKMEEKMGGNFS